MKKTSPKKLEINAVSKKTGIAHRFLDVDVWNKVVRDFEQKPKARERTDLLNGLAFFDLLEKNPCTDLKPNVKWGKHTYRIATVNRDPLSVAGSLADGGRFNIGGSQQHPLFKHVRKGACLYAASTLECALAEAGKMMGTSIKYRPTPKKRFNLWDLSDVISHLQVHQLEEQIAATPIEAFWGFQKVPLIPQLLANHLRNLGGDGIVYKSIQMPSAQNLAFFFDTDAQCASAFKCEPIENL